ncbi:MAG: hypothetical protein V1645_04360 [archaeon]
MGMVLRFIQRKEIRFREGLLHLVDRETKNHKRILEFGKNSEDRHEIGTSELNIIKKYFYPLKFKEITPYLYARRTITGGLQLWLKRPMSRYFAVKQYADLFTFTRKEYKTIEQYI